MIARYPRDSRDHLNSVYVYRWANFKEFPPFKTLKESVSRADIDGIGLRDLSLQWKNS